MVFWWAHFQRTPEIARAPMSDQRSARFAVFALILSLFVGSGCQSMLFLMNSEKQKAVPAECDKLRGQRVALVVWAEHSTLDADPFACERTARAINLVFAANASKKELKGTTFVDQQTVSSMQEQLGN